MTPDEAPAKGWPFPEPFWYDPPLALEGNVLTAWFDADISDLARLVHSDFLPAGSRPRCRVRFYDVKASAQGHQFSQRECAIAFNTSYHGVEGEMAARLFTDSPTYLMWGREVYGMPLNLGSIRLSGGFWAEEMEGAADCLLEGVAQLSDVRIRHELEAPVEAPPTWITPHRILDPSNLDSEIRRVYALRPRIFSSGRRYSCSGQLPVVSFFSNLSDVKMELTTGIHFDMGATNAELI